MVRRTFKTQDGNTVNANENKSILFLSYVKFFDEQFFSNFRNVIETDDNHEYK